jgi:hypothetical protein
MRWQELVDVSRINVNKTLMSAGSAPLRTE